MEKKRNTLLFLLGASFALIAAVLLVRSHINKPYTSGIPDLAESVSLSEAVKEQIADASDLAKRKPSAENLGMLGMVYHSSANYEEAEACYLLAVQRKKSDWIWNYYLGFLSIEMGDSDGVLAYFNAVIKSDPGIFHAWYYAGEAYMNQRKYSLAEQYFEKILNINKRNPDTKSSSREDQFPLGIYARFQLARIYAETERLDLAEKYLKEIVGTYRTFGPAYRLLGNLYKMKGEVSLSERYGAWANDLMLFSPPVDNLLDKIVLQSRSEMYLLKKIDEAVNSMHSEWAFRLINQGLEYLPDNKYLVSKAIKVCLWMDLQEEAKRFIEQHISLFQDDSGELLEVAMSFFLRQLYPQATRYFEQARALNPENLSILKNLAICYGKLDEKQKSEDLLNHMISSYPGNMVVLAEVTDVMFFELQKQEEATVYLDRLHQAIPANPKVQKISAQLADIQGKKQEAIVLYTSSFRGDPDDYTTIKNLGSILIEQKMWAQSIAHFREALTYHPNEAYFLERLGTLLITCQDESLRNIPEGLEYAERAFLHHIRRPLIIISAGRSLAYAYSMLGDNRNAYAITNTVLIMARSINLPQENIQDLENMLKRFQSSMQ